ncbi:Superoxide dismutase [Cu-Zn] precursor [Lysobacter dokdonensis DS-58]|uniref:Superoxide dismutase [Cu-Zn] n=1 Tax=Lysobacter dokdonensis DS-58 TaxID=1300345 RepID=A0A0A2WZB6_9GAMM|nr:superoxide dismutase family protein [Lysobacter dokdonensis]KGQ18344.1 Superoxide dismutase [Cu-Zn] precursor [Lysobacter dokdonensis DS-58]
MRHALAVIATLTLAACATAPKPTPPPAAQSTAKEGRANLASASGSLVSGRVTLRPMRDGVHLTGIVGGFMPNSVHAIHVHEKGDCTAADASSAGGHFNPGGQPHGRANSATHHAGDMDNITANAQGQVNLDIHLAGVTLGGGAPNDIADRALVVHAAADDYTSQPAGNAGARVACAPIKIVQ